MAEKAKDGTSETPKNFLDKAKKFLNAQAQRLQEFARKLAKDDSSNKPNDFIPKLANQAKTIWEATTSSLLTELKASLDAFFEFALVKDRSKIKETAENFYNKLVADFKTKFLELHSNYQKARKALQAELAGKQKTLEEAQQSLHKLNERLTGDKNSEPDLRSEEEKSRQRAIDLALIGISVALELVIGQFLVAESSTRIVAWLFSAIVAVFLTFFALQYGKCKKVISYAEENNLEVKKSTLTQKTFAKGMYAGTLAFLLLIRIIAFLIAQSNINLLFEAVIVTASLIGLSVLSGYLKFSMASVYEESDIKTYEKALGKINGIRESIGECEEKLKELNDTYRNDLENLIQSFQNNLEIAIPVEEINASQSQARELLDNYYELQTWLKDTFYDAIEDITDVLSANETLSNLYFQENGGKLEFKPEVSASIKEAIKPIFESVPLKDYNLEILKNFTANSEAEEIRKSINLPDFKEITVELEAEAMAAAMPKQIEKIVRD